MRPNLKIVKTQLQFKILKRFINIYSPSLALYGITKPQNLQLKSLFEIF